MKVLYIRDRKDLSKGQRVITVVSEYNKLTGAIKIAWSVCSKHDTFVKATGLYIAKQRFENIGKKSNKQLEYGDIDFYKFNGKFMYVGNGGFKLLTEAITRFVLHKIDSDKKELTTKEGV